ncbi:DnaJ domain [Macleaya cordata]|uniref:DnaJ domain n=1 Tax=Macleaya cordata TaxID=56857 RepID=A0A200RAA8_MACCD|nr:DnaJ domain [Macleaya cordata]
MFAHSSPSSPSFLRSSPEFVVPTSTTQKFVSTNTPSPAYVRFRSPCISAAYTTSSAETARSPPPYLSTNMASSSASLYEVLGLPMGATGHEIKAAYRKLARVCHPDVLAIDRKDNSADAFIKIHAAYSTLSDPEKRADYDRKLFRRRQPFDSSFSSSSSYNKSTMSGFTGYTRRNNWETDQCW